MSNNIGRLFAQLIETTELRKVDFKRDQYRLDNDRLKSEMIKDILCMANAPGEDGYILLGVKAEKGKPRQVTGISYQHDGSELEQIANSIIDEPIQFEYYPFNYRGKECAIIHIPKSKAKPHWPKKDYGVLRRHVIYTRRSSGNREASIQEIREICIATMHISDIAQHKAKSSSHIVDEFSDLSLDERKQAMYRMLKTVMPKIGLVRPMNLLSPVSSRHLCTLVTAEARKVVSDYAIFMYPWTATSNDIRAARYDAANFGKGTSEKRLRASTKNRLQRSTLIHIAYKGIHAKSLESKAYIWGTQTYSLSAYLSADYYWFANEWTLDWGRVMKWEGTVRINIRDKITHENRTKYEFFLPNVASKDELQERLDGLLRWVDENLSV